MSGRESQTDDSTPEAGAQTDIPPDNPHFDAANRLERSIDVQIQTINSIDNKAEHVTRLLGILLGAVLSVLSLGVQSSISFGDAGAATWIAFLVGVGSLVLSMAAAIVTYLSSKFPVGMSENAGKLLSDPDYNTDMEQHLRRLIGNYSDIIRINRVVIETNSRRFRRALVLLLGGVAFLATAAILFIGQFKGTIGFGILGVMSTVMALLSRYILSGRYLTVEALQSLDGH